MIPWTTCLQDSGFAVTRDSSEMSVYDRDGLNVSSTNSLIDRQNSRFFQLYQNYPNPFNSQTVIAFDIYHPGNMQLHIYDSNGSLVKSLIDGEWKDVGNYIVNWDGTNNQGKILSSGVYFYKLILGKFSKTKALVLAK
jgi:hypothetical protein